MTSEWAVSSNAEVDDDFFSTIDTPELIWNNDNNNVNNNEQDDMNYRNNIGTTHNDGTVNALLASPSVCRSGIEDQDNNSDNNDIYDIGQEENDYQDITEKIDDNPNPNTYNFVDEPITIPSHDNDYDNENNTNNAENVDVVLATELNALSFQQRESINEEIHGINVNQIYLDKIKEIEETPELLEESFIMLQWELNILQNDSFAYDRCQQLYGNKNDNKNNKKANDDGMKKDNVDDNNNDDDVVDNDEESDVIRNTTSTTNFVNTDAFRLMFLRCELFDATKAARRLINYVALMYELYGDIGLQRRIQIGDMSEEEIRILKLGSLQLLPGRDRAGRRVFIHIAHNATNLKYTVKSRLRILYYLQVCLADDVETQQKGFVAITWYHNLSLFDDFSTRTKVYNRIANCLPVRSGAAHICISGELDGNYSVSNGDSSVSSSLTATTKTSPSRSGTPSNIIIKMIALSLDAKLRSKLRIHTGSAMECVYALQSFGIPSNQIPLVVGATTVNNKKRKKETKRNAAATAAGENSNNNNNNNNKSNHLKLENHMKWFKLCQLKGNNIKSCGKKWKNYDDTHHGYNGDQQIIEVPKHADILFGRGLNAMKHPGNALLRSIVASKVDEYMKLKSHTDKIKITLDVVHLLKNKYDVRFLKEETIETDGKLGCWIEVSDEAARTKVRVSFRDKIVQQQHYVDKQQKINLQQQAQFSTTSSLILDQQENINNSSRRSHRQIRSRKTEEETDSSTSMFLSMTGGDGGSSGCSGCGSRKKRQL